MCTYAAEGYMESSNKFLLKFVFQRKAIRTTIHLKADELNYNCKNGMNWRELPARAPEQLEEIMERITIHNYLVRASDNTQCDLSDYGHLPQYIQRCTEWMFQMATTLVFYNLDPPAGLTQFQRLAQRGHIDSMVACGIILVEGLGVPSREKEGLIWLEKAVDEDVVKAFALFEKAAEQDHTAAIYMVADCLVEGEGTERSVARAVPLFYKAADRGHRFSRQRIRGLLARVDYPLIKLHYMATGRKEDTNGMVQPRHHTMTLWCTFPRMVIVSFASHTMVTNQY